MKKLPRLALIIFMLASTSSHAALAQRLIIQFSDILSPTEQRLYQQKISAIAPVGFEIIQYDRRWILVLPAKTTPEQLTALASEISLLEKVNFVEKDLPMKKLSANPT